MANGVKRTIPSHILKCRLNKINMSEYDGCDCVYVCTAKEATIVVGKYGNGEIHFIHMRNGN